MKKLLAFVILFIPVSIYSTVISPHSPWGIAYRAGGKLPPQFVDKPTYHRATLDSVINAGISWIKPTCSPLNLLISNLTFLEKTSILSLKGD